MEISSSLPIIITTLNHSDYDRHTVAAEFQTNTVDSKIAETLKLVDEVSMYLWLVIALTGITTNIINIHTFMKMGLEDSVTISFFAMATSDLLVSILAFSQPLAYFSTLIIEALDLGFHFPYSIPLLFIRNFASSFTQATVLITTYLAIQRCLCVLFPFHVKGLFTKVKTYWYIIVVTIFSVVCFGLYTTSFHVVDAPVDGNVNRTELIVKQRPNTDQNMFLVDVILGLCINTFCVSTAIICLCIMLFTLRRSARFRKSMTARVSKNTNVTPSTEVNEKKEKTSSKETQALKQVFVITSIFVSTNCPYVIWSIVNILIPDFRSNKAYRVLFYSALTAMLTAEYINSAVNFFVYFNFNTKFRKLCVLTSQRITGESTRISSLAS